MKMQITGGIPTAGMMPWDFSVGVAMYPSATTNSSVSE